MAEYKAYCFVCGQLVNVRGAKVTTEKVGSGYRKMVKGRCPWCKTKVSGIIGKGKAPKAPPSYQDYVPRPKATPIQAPEIEIPRGFE